MAPGVAEVARALGTDARELAATGGEDYELCVCVPPAAARRRGGRGGRDLGRARCATGAPGARLTRDGEPVALEGFQHRS